MELDNFPLSDPKPIPGLPPAPTAYYVEVFDHEGNDFGGYVGQSTEGEMSVAIWAILRARTIYNIPAGPTGMPLIGQPYVMQGILLN